MLRAKTIPVESGYALASILKRNLDKYVGWTLQLVTVSSGHGGKGFITLLFKEGGTSLD